LQVIFKRRRPTEPMNVLTKIRPAAAAPLSRQASARPRGAEWAVLAAGLVMLLTLEFTRLDRLLVLPFDAQARDFPLRTAWFTTTVSHEGLTWSSAAVFGWLLLGLRWPLGVLQRLDARGRAYVVGSATLCLILIPLAKRFSYTHCPWDLEMFGGSADYLRLFDWPEPGAATAFRRAMPRPRWPIRRDGSRGAT
jgi:membrane-associated PAP2 superfamily phosphatase